MCKVCFREKSDTAPIVIGCRYLLSPLSAHSLFLFSISLLATFMGKDLVVPKIFRTFALLSRDTLRIS